MKDYALDQVQYDQYGNVDVAYYSAKARKLRSVAASKQIEKAADVVKGSIEALAAFVQQPKAA